MICKAKHTEMDDFFCVVSNDEMVKYVVSDDDYENEIKLPNIPAELCSEDEKNVMGRYKHFKGNDYEVLGITFDKDKNKYVLYKALYECDIKFFIRPYDMFFSKVDRDKYPDVKQEYRFEKVN